MALAPGIRVGPYEILSPIGAGGMGEVYRARDTKLNRDVALKIVPDAFAADPDRLTRFRREAHVLASLNHPNIGHIYGVEDSGATPALVLELVEGPTLAERLARGPIALGDALPIARQIADALEAAHDRDIIHRDLKPANIKLTGAWSSPPARQEDGRREPTLWVSEVAGCTVKVLDFGLAKTLDPPGGSEAAAVLAGAPTISSPATLRGMLLGTAAYMSPEQAQGKAVDKRSDIWAFGVVVFEMLTGRHAFPGEDVVHVLAAVLKTEPDWTALPADTPATIRKLLRRCLEKNRARRLGDIHDARLEIDDALTTPPDDTRELPVQSVGSLSAWRAAAGVLGVLLALVAVLWAPWRVAHPADLPWIRLNVDLGPEAVAGPSFEVALSPDGTRLAFAARAPDKHVLLATRLLAEPTLTFLAGTEDATSPFFSPDGQSIGFVAGGQMKKISVHGGAAVSICELPGVSLGASWGEDGNIVFAPGTTAPLLRVPSTGGTPQPLTRVGEQGDATHRWPQVLPGGRAVLFTSHKIITGFDDARIDVVTSTGERKTVLRGGYFGRYIASREQTGYLLYMRAGTLFGVPFDSASLEVHGTPSPLLEDVAGNSDLGAGHFDFSQTGTFVYRSGQGPARAWPVLWMDSAGKTQALIAEAGAYYTPSFSPDGTRLALTVDHGDKGREIAVYDWRRGALSRLTFTGEVNLFPVWSPDGRYIVFESSSPKGYGIGLIRSDGSGGVQRLAEHQGLMIPSSFSPDGKRLAYQEQNPQAAFDIWTALFDTRDAEHPTLGKTEPFLNTPFNEASAVFSPSGRWVAYHSNESGRTEVYVRPVAGPGGKVPISTGGGSSPVWAPSGHELYFREPGSHIMVTDYTEKGDAFEAGTPRVWSATPTGLTTFVRDLSLSPDGKRFAVFPPREAPAATGTVHVAFVLNFFDELRRIVATSNR